MKSKILETTPFTYPGTFDDFVEFVVAKAQKTIVRDGEHVPMVFTITTAPDHLVYVLHSILRSERPSIAARIIVEREKPDAFITISEAWMKRYSMPPGTTREEAIKKGESFWPVSKQPDKEEVLMITAKSVKGTRQIAFLMTRKDGKIVLGKRRESTLDRGIVPETPLGGDYIR
jgi:hypothetical protein